MPLTGKLVYASSGFGWNYSGYLFVIGEDDQHYVVQNDTGYAARVGLAETNALVGGVTTAQWQTDITDNVEPPPAAPLTYYMTIAAKGTPYFFVAGALEDSGVPFSYLHQTIIFIRYKINSDGDVVYDGYARYRFDNSGGGDLLFFGPFVGASVIQGRLYFVGNMTDNHTIGKQVFPCLLDLPLSGDEDDTDSGSIALHSTLLDFSWTYINEINSDGRNLEPKCAVFEADDTGPLVGVVVCKDQGDYLGPALLGMTVSGGDCSAVEDLASDFGWPFSDSGFNYAGAAGGTRDRYTISSIAPVVGGGFEVIFARVFSDNQQYARVKQFNMATLWGTATLVNEVTYQHTAETVSGTAESVQYYREGNILEGGLRAASRIFFGFVAIPSLDAEGNIGGSGMQFEPRGCVLQPRLHTLEVRDLHSIVEVGPFRFTEGVDSDETSFVTTLVVGLTEKDIGIVVEIDMATEPDIEIDMDALVDVLGDDIEIDMGEGVENSDDFTLELLGNEDGSSFPGAPLPMQPEILQVIADFGSKKHYAPLGYSYTYHRLKLKAFEIDESFELKTVDISGMISGRQF